MLPFVLSELHLAERELHHFAKAGVAEDYDTLLRKKSTESSRLSSVALVLQKLASNITQLLLIIMIMGLALHIITYISSSFRAESPLAFVALPASPGRLSQHIAAVPQAVASPSAAHEITMIQTSRYNKNYYCIVKRTRWTGSSCLSIDFILVGDRSLGDLQDPMASILRWPGGSRKAKSHAYQVDDLKNEFVEGTLLYEGVPQDKTLDFEFGSSGYSWVKLAPLKNELPPLSHPLHPTLLVTPDIKM